MCTLSENSDNTTRLASGCQFRWKSLASINKVLPREFGQGIYKFTYCTLDISLGLNRGSTKCLGSKVYLVVLSIFYKSAGYPIFFCKQLYDLKFIIITMSTPFSILSSIIRTSAIRIRYCHMIRYTDRVNRFSGVQVTIF